MAESDELLIKLRADIGDLADGLKSATSKMQGFSAMTVAEGSLIADAFKAIGQKVIQFGIDSVKAYGEQEQAVTRLAIVVGGTAANALSDYASELQKTTTYQDDAIVSMQAQLAGFGLYPGTVKDATKTLIDFAAATGKDLPEAANVLGQAMAGQGRELKKFGLELSATDTRADNLDKTLKFLDTRFGGAAETMKGTFLGSLQNMQNKFHELQENIGKELVPVFVTWVGWLSKAFDYVQKLTGATMASKSVDEITIETLKKKQAALLDAAKAQVSNGVALTKQQQDEIKLNVALIKATEDRMAADKKVTDKLKGDAPLHKGVIESDIDAVRKLKEEIQALELAQAHVTQITELETKKRIMTSKNAWETNASFSDQLTVKMTEDLNNTTAVFVNMATTMIDSFATSTAKMIVEGGRFSDVLKNLWKQLAEMIIAQILRMIAEWIVFQALTGGAGGGLGGFFGGFMAEGGIINEPSMITGLKSGNTHIAGEAGPEMVVPMSRSLGAGPSGNVAVATSADVGQQAAGNNAGGDIHIHISGQFVEANPAKWQDLIRKVIVPEIKRYAQYTPTGPFTRTRGVTT